MAQVNLNNTEEIKEAGFKALLDALGPAGFIKFFQQMSPGKGDYTKEKYEQPEESREKILQDLQKYVTDCN